MRLAGWLLMLTAAWAGEAAGHAGLAASVPADGATLPAPPPSIELRFTEPVTPVAVRLFAGSEAPVNLRVPEGVGDVVTLAVPPDLREGLYTLSFRVISADSHPIGGSIVFAVGSRPPVRPTSIQDSGLLGARIVLRAVRDLALLIAAGGALFALCIAGFPGERIIIATAAAVTIVAAVVGVGVQGADMLDTALWSLEAWRSGLLSSFGLSAGVASAGALLVTFAAGLRGGSLRAWLLLAGALTAIGSLPLTGHAMTARPGPVAVSALAAHGLAAAFWIGSLAALLAIMSPRGPGDAAAAPVLQRFSRWAMGAVAVLIVAGIIFVVLQLGSVAELIESRYGWLVGGKVMLLLGLLALAVLNRFRWLPMLQRGVTGAAGRLRWSIAGEVALASCVIGVTAILVQTPPPRASAVDRGYTQKLAYGEDFAEVSVKPARAGMNALVVRFQDRDGLPFDPEEVLVHIGNDAAGVEPAARPIRRVGPGHYSRDGSEFAFPGVWTLEVQARIDSKDIATFRSKVPIR